MWFLWNYFSIRQLVRTFFVPYKRLGESAVTIFDFFNYFSAIVITALMRIVGVIVRSIVIAIGLVSIFFTVIFGFIFLIVWLLAPVIFVIAFGVGARLALRPF